MNASRNDHASVFQHGRLLQGREEERRETRQAPMAVRHYPGGVPVVLYKSRALCHHRQNVPLEYFLHVLRKYLANGSLPSSQADWPSLLCR
jgi:hypothetical protein